MSRCLPVTSHVRGRWPSRAWCSVTPASPRPKIRRPAGWRGAFGGHVAKGATIARDRRRARNGLVRDAGAVFEPHKSDVRDPGHRERMEPVNDLCSWPKGCLRRFAGMSMGSMQGYINRCVHPFRANKAGDGWPKAPTFPKTHDVAEGS